MSLSATANSSIRADVVPFAGWRNNLRVSNGYIELIVTLEVGPRILSFTRSGGPNPFKVYADQVGSAGESVWRNRGGHRFWIAPETREVTYHPDNAPVAWETLPDGRGVRITPPAETATGFQKQLDLLPDPTGPGATIVHRLTRLSGPPAEVAIWGLTVMTTGGVAIMPQPPLGQHPRDLLPNRKMILWPYTDLGDPRWRFGSQFLRLRQDTARGPTKIGLADPLGWCGYFVEGVFFFKRYAWQESAPYPDYGCNFETFTNEKMLEVESLAPLTRLEAGRSIEHRERWELHAAPDFRADASDDAIAAFLQPILRGGAIS